MIQALEPEPEVGLAFGERKSSNNTPQVRTVSAEIMQRPRLGCAGLIRRGDQVLLGKRNKEPNRGLWVLPGGGVEFGESFATTLERELREEAGIGVEVRNIFKT